MTNTVEDIIENRMLHELKKASHINDKMKIITNVFVDVVKEQLERYPELHDMIKLVTQENFMLVMMVIDSIDSEGKILDKDLEHFKLVRDKVTTGNDVKGEEFIRNFKQK